VVVGHSAKHLAMVFGRADLLGRVSVIILILGLLALFLLPHPWNEAAFSAAFGWEIATILFALWYSQRGRAQVGSETLIGQAALVITACFPTGQVKVGGETWMARCEAGASVGQQVRVRAVDGLTLTVELDEAS
jgi:membrane protein implicated in regulation of membrane protease activity